jgi:hypothetical protein
MTRASGSSRPLENAKKATSHRLLMLMMIQELATERSTQQQLQAASQQQKGRCLCMYFVRFVVFCGFGLPNVQHPCKQT